MKSCLFSGRNSVTPISFKLVILETAGPLHRALSHSHTRTHKQSQSQRILHYPLDQSTSHRHIYFSHLSHAVNAVPFSLLNFTGVMMMLQRCRRLAEEHMRRVSRFMTNCHKRGGLDCNFRHQLSECAHVEGERQQREGEQRVNSFLSVTDDERGPPGI